MSIEELIADIKKGDMTYRGSCHECDAQVEVNAKLREDGAIEIDGNGAVYKTKKGQETKYFFKCDACFKKNRDITRFQKDRSLFEERRIPTASTTVEPGEAGRV